MKNGWFRLHKKIKTKKPTSTLPVPRSTSSIQVQDALTRYMNEVSRYQLLTPEEEEAAARHYVKHQDKESAQRLVLANLRLVVKIAMEYHSAFQNVLDLIQEGNMGLLRAVEKYDVDKNVRFSSYAAWWVRAFILKYIIDNFRLVKIGTTQAQKKLFFNLMKEKEQIEKLGFKSTPKLLSERLDVKEDEVREMELRMGTREVELDAPRPNYEGASQMDFVASPVDSVEDRVEENELQDILMRNLGEFTAGLNPKEKAIFQERLFSEMPKTLQEIADEYKITRERIRQIESRVIDKVRVFFKEKGMDVNIKQE